MNKILIIGNSGSGKTWLGKRLANTLHQEAISLDSIVWEPGGYNQKRSQETVSAELHHLANKEMWIVEGVFGALAETLLPYADVLIFLDMPWDICKTSLLERGSESAKQHDKARAEQNFNALIQWASEYDIRQSKNSHRFHQQLFTRFNKQGFRFTDRTQVDEFLNTLKISCELN